MDDETKEIAKIYDDLANAEEAEVEASEVEADEPQEEVQDEPQEELEAEEPEATEEVADEGPADVDESPESEEPITLTESEPENDFMALLHPNSLNADERELFDSLPDRKSKRLAKEFIDRRDLQYKQSANKMVLRLNQEFAEATKKYEPLDKLEKDNEYYLQENGLSLTDVASNALEWDRALESNPMQAIWELMQQNSIHPSDYANGNPQGHAGQYRQPAQPQQTNINDSPEFRAMQARLDQQDAAVQQQEQQAIEKDIETFKNHKGEDGKAYYGLYQYVEADMARRVPTLMEEYPTATRLELLHAAYDQAVWANPQTREMALNAQQRATAPKKVPAKKPTSLTTKQTLEAPKKKDNRKLTDEEEARRAYDEVASNL